jgi:hypothetical protein
LKTLTLFIKTKFWEIESSMGTEDQGIIYTILSVMPGIGTIWGMVFYAVFTYFITFCLTGTIHYWANKNIDVNKIIKERVT